MRISTQFFSFLTRIDTASSDVALRTCSTFLLGLALMMGSTSVFAQSNTGGLAFTENAFGEVMKYPAIDFSEKEDAITIEMWVKHDEKSDEDAVLLGNQSSFDGNGYILHLDGRGEEVRVSFKPTGITRQWMTSETPIVAGRWYHIAATYNANTESGSLFINGEQEATAGAGAQTIASAPNLVIGSIADKSSNFFQGNIDEVRIWDRALSSIEINQKMTEEINEDEDGLVAYFRMNEASGNTLSNKAASVDGDLTGEFTLSAAGATPVPPVEVRAEPGRGEIDVHFDRPDFAETDVSEYTIYRTEAGGMRQELATIGADETVYTDATADENTLYFYEVGVTTTNGSESDFSSRIHGILNDRSGLRFTGDGFADLGKTPSFENIERAEEIAVDLWVKHSGKSDEDAVLLGNKVNLVEDNGYALHLKGQGKEVRVSFTPTFIDRQQVTSETSLVAGRWYHIAATYNASSGNTKLFINGEQDATASAGGQSIANDLPLVIGSNANKNSNFFQGEIDEARVWNTSSITPSELMSEPLVGNEEGLVGYWRFDEPSGSEVVRSSARPLTGSLTGEIDLNTPGSRPAAPINVRAKPADGNVKVRFEQPSYTEVDVSEYTIYRTEAGGTRQELATIEADERTYTDDSAMEGTLYFYEVVLTDTEGRESDFSARIPGILHETQSGNAAQFSGTNSYVEIGKPPSLENIERAEEIAVDFWVKYNGESDEDAVLLGNKENLTEDNGYVVHLDGQGEEVQVSFTPTFIDRQQVTSETSLEAGRWYHVAATYSATSGNTKLFINGELEATAGAGGQSIANDLPLVIGSNANKNGNFFQGEIDEVRVWNIASITPGEIKDKLLFGDEEGLVGYWRFDEPQGSEVVRNSARPLMGPFNNGSFVPSDNPLPVEMAGFEAITEGDEVQLTWQTASETNNAGFEVQRKATGKGEAEWTEVGFVDSKAEGGTTNEVLSYRFTDADLPYEADWLEYRLRQVDTDGTATLTDPVTVERAVEELRLKKTFPNPARGQATVRFAVPERRDVSLELYDVLGRQVRTVQQGEREGRQELQVDLSDLASGTYFLRLSAEGTVRTQKLTIVQ